MIVLDTNVLSEALRPLPEPSVLVWLAKQPRASLFTTTVLRRGSLWIRLLADGKRRRGLWTPRRDFCRGFAVQVLSFDSDAADMYAEIAVSRRMAGSRSANRRHDCRNGSFERGILATRNAKDFERLQHRYCRSVDA